MFLLLLDFNSVLDMEKALNQMEIEGVLLDSYVAGHYSKTFYRYKVNRVFQAPKSYGFVLGRRLSASSIYKRFKGYIDKNEEFVTALVEKKTTTPHVSLIPGH